MHVTDLENREWWKFSDNSCRKIVDLHSKVALLEFTTQCDKLVIEALTKRLQEAQSCSTQESSTSTTTDQSQLPN